MYLPRNDFDCVYDHRDFVMSWPRIVATAAASLLLLAIVTPAALLVSVFGRAPPLEPSDPLRQALAKARRV